MRSSEGKLQLRGIDHGDGAAAFDFQGVVRADESRGVFVEANAHRKRIEGKRRGQAAEAITLAEMLVDDEAVWSGRARATGQRCRPLVIRLPRRRRSCAR
jgi:hypothetical protein